MENQEAINKIEFDYEGHHYVLEYTPESIKRMESAGFVIGELYDKPQLRIEQLWDGAFIAHESRVSANVRKNLFNQMKCKKIIRVLAEMYNNVLSQLVPDIDSDDEEYTGNVKWTATP